jgi:hypothetical protein
LERFDEFKFSSKAKNIIKLSFIELQISRENGLGRMFPNY